MFEVGDAAGFAPGGGDDFNVAVTVEVGGDGFKGVGKAFADYVLCATCPFVGWPSFSYQTIW